MIDLKNNELRWALAAVLSFFGLVMVVGDLSSNGLTALIEAEVTGEKASIGGPWLVTGLVLTLGGALFGATAFIASKGMAPEDDEAQLVGYDTALLGLGFALVMLGVLNFVALAGFATAGELKAILGAPAGPASGLEQTEPRAAPKVEREAPAAGAAAGQPPAPEVAAGPEAGPPPPAPEKAAPMAPPRPGDGIRNMMRMLLMPGFAALGSLFFVAGALRVKRQKLEEKINGPPAGGNSGSGDGRSIKFNGLRFWGGLWYRMGEAILFALVFFLAITSGYLKIEGANRVWILLVALILGMFVKPAEQLINGLAMRLFEGVKAMLK